MKRLLNTRNKFTVMDYQDLMAVSRSLEPILETSQPLQANKNQMVQARCQVVLDDNNICNKTTKGVE